MTGNRIKKLRTSLNLTQKDFAKLLGLSSYEWVSRAENNRIKISGPLKKICEMLEKSSINKIPNKI